MVRRFTYCCATLHALGGGGFLPPIIRHCSVCGKAVGVGVAEFNIIIRRARSKASCCCFATTNPGSDMPKLDYAYFIPPFPYAAEEGSPELPVMIERPPQTA